MSTEKKTLLDKFLAVIEKMAGPATTFANYPVVKGIQNGMVATTGITLVGSLFLVLLLFVTDGNLTAKALLPFLTPYAGQIGLVNSLALSIIAVYMAIGMGAEMGFTLGIDKTTGAIGSFFAFILLTNAEATIDTSFWSGAGIIIAIVGAIVSSYTLKLCKQYHIEIKLPDSVPPAIANSFSAIIPYFIIALLCWGTRTILGFNLGQFVADLLLPVLNGADNIFVYTLVQFLITVFWSLGIHGDNLTGAVMGTFTAIWNQENIDAGAKLLAAGQTVTRADLPHVYALNIGRTHQWCCSFWPILFYMFTSKKLSHLRPLAWTSLPPAIFCIIEPIMFGLPVVLNPFMIIPFIISHTVTGALAYLIYDLGIVTPQYISLPWASPSPLIGYLGSGGSILGGILPFVWFALGLVIFYPFWKAYENAEVKRMAAEVAE